MLMGLLSCLTDADLRAHPACHVAFLARMHVSRDSEAHAIAFCSAGRGVVFWNLALGAQHMACALYALRNDVRLSNEMNKKWS